MSNPVKISDALNLAIHALVVVSSNEQKRVNTTEIANICGVSSNHIAKVMQRLVHGGILKSVRWSFRWIYPVEVLQILLLWMFTD
jgi:predicted transcriptional regulator of viral defense system